MPNESNIESPIQLVAFGRSGTSLISNVFERHPDFRFVGETANLIFGSWDAVEFSAGGIPQLFDGSYWVSEDERAGRVIRQTFLTCFPDDKKYWFHKPIGVPTAVMSKFDRSRWDEAGEWYWKVMRTSFPHAKYFTLLRHPCDVVLSAQSYWGHDEGGLWWALGFIAYLLTHPASPVRYAIHFDELTESKQDVLQRLFAYLQVPFDAESLGAFDTIHAPAQGRDDLSRHTATRRNEWSRLNPAFVQPFYLEQIDRLFDQFGYALEWPDHFVKVHPVQDSPPEDEVQDGDSEDPYQVIDQLNKTIERLHIEYREKLRVQERKFHTDSADLKQWVGKLEEGKAWLEQQWQSWKATAEVQQSRIAELEKQQVAKTTPQRNHRLLRLARKLAGLKPK
ncbi:MAG: hypothetical protein H6970_07160 [Gammaproteobacteria bacterium]|nr:hypothetical protein [Gammaproteobacteria bacterium]MCP5424833.1 hypothetical protein [Gammaproteobacteria bacterium]MCP5458190.1 hypothetical protein [Gammaproteobacteria bacterium]